MLGMGMGSKPFEAWVGKFDVFAIGGEAIRNARLEIGDVDEIPGTKAEMLLGADFMFAHHVFVSYTQSRVYLTYNGGPVFRAREPKPPVATTDGSQK